MRFGFHVSIAGGLRNAVMEARARRCQTIQIFSRNPQGWKFKELDSNDVEEFRAGIKESDICPVTVHMPYLANIGTPNQSLYKRSVESVAVDLSRCARIGAQYLVMHMGRSKSSSEQELVSRMARAIDMAYEAASHELQAASRGIRSLNTKTQRHQEEDLNSSLHNLRIRFDPLPRLLLENTAGMGTDFLQLRAVINSVAKSSPVGVVLDTAHLFEAGWELRTKSGLDRLLRDFDAQVGLQRLYLLHLNDSKTDLGSHLDRHWHIGKGKIGKAGFRLIVNHPLLRHLPGVMETPRLTLKEDRMNLRAITALFRPVR
jgi:deoxyribonuclease-4